MNIHFDVVRIGVRAFAPPLQGRHGWCKFGLISIKEKAGTEGLWCNPKNSLGPNDRTKSSNAAAQ
jgi:hypothetical protein